MLLPSPSPSPSSCSASERALSFDPLDVNASLNAKRRGFKPIPVDFLIEAPPVKIITLKHRALSLPIVSASSNARLKLQGQETLEQRQRLWVGTANPASILRSRFGLAHPRNVERGYQCERHQAVPRDTSAPANSDSWPPLAEEHQV